MSHYFISDCHLTPDEPETVDYFYQFIKQHQSNMESLSILGDFFEVWIGDDSLDPWSEAILNTLKNTGAKLKFLAGNRDFLLSTQLLAHFNIEQIADNSLVEFNHTKILLAHGDQLCTDDTKYQAFRTMVRAKQWQQDFLSKTLAERQAIVKTLRQQSKQAMKAKQENIMDVNEQTVSHTFSNNNVNIMIHGHTHREGLHRYPSGQQRWVLAAWHNAMAYLKLDVFNTHLQLQLRPSGHTQSIKTTQLSIK